MIRQTDIKPRICKGEGFCFRENISTASQQTSPASQLLSKDINKVPLLLQKPCIKHKPNVEV